MATSSAYTERLLIVNISSKSTKTLIYLLNLVHFTPKFSHSVVMTTKDLKIICLNCGIGNLLIFVNQWPVDRTLSLKHFKGLFSICDLNKPLEITFPCDYTPDVPMWKLIEPLLLHTLSSTFILSIIVNPNSNVRLTTSVFLL